MPIQPRRASHPNNDDVHENNDLYCYACSERSSRRKTSQPTIATKERVSVEVEGDHRCSYKGLSFNGTDDDKHAIPAVITVPSTASLSSPMRTSSQCAARTPTRAFRGVTNKNYSTCKVSGSQMKMGSPTSVLHPPVTIIGNSPQTAKQRLKKKTEMCTLYPACPYGKSCHFAHSREELRRLPLLDLARSGFLHANLAEYRVRPCLMLVMTGCCPFGNRCDGLHDERVQSISIPRMLCIEAQDVRSSGKKNDENRSSNKKFDGKIPATSRGDDALVRNLYKAWLPHKDKVTIFPDGNFTQLYVNSSHYEQIRHVHGNVVVLPETLHSVLSHSLISFKKRWLTGGSGATLGRDNHRNHTATYDHCLVITLKMLSGIEQSWEYHTTHTHLPAQQGCMILQYKIFDCLTAENGDAIVKEVKVTDESKRDIQLVAVEVAYGPSHCSKARQQSIYFIKPSRMKKGNKYSVIIEPVVSDLFIGVLRPPFAKNKLKAVLGTDQMSVMSLPVHRFMSSWHNELVSNLISSYLVKSHSLYVTRAQVWKQIKSMRIHMDKWQWPITQSRRNEAITEDTLDPDVCMEYELDGNQNGQEKLGNCAKVIWQSFVERNGKRSVEQKKRLNIFANLTAREEGENENALLGHKTNHDLTSAKCLEEIKNTHLGNEGEEPFITVKGRRKNRKSTEPSATQTLSRSEACWRSLLLHDGPNDWKCIETEFSSFM